MLVSFVFLRTLLTVTYLPYFPVRRVMDDMSDAESEPHREVDVALRPFAVLLSQEKHDPRTRASAGSAGGYSHA